MIISSSIVYCLLSQPEKIKSVEDALKSLTSRESIHGYLCPRTKQTVEASYQTFLDQLPPILILHLKLFVYDKDGGSKKLNKKIDYKVDLELPRECLHMDRGGDKNRYSKSYKLLSGESKAPFDFFAPI